VKNHWIRRHSHRLRSTEELKSTECASGRTFCPHRCTRTPFLRLNGINQIEKKRERGLELERNKESEKESEREREREREREKERKRERKNEEKECVCVSEKKENKER